jgi:hypothetical protein
MREPAGFQFTPVAIASAMIAPKEKLARGDDPEKPCQRSVVCVHPIPANERDERETHDAGRKRPHNSSRALTGEVERHSETG